MLREELNAVVVRFLDTLHCLRRNSSHARPSFDFIRTSNFDAIWMNVFVDERLHIYFWKFENECSSQKLNSRVKFVFSFSSWKSSSSNLIKIFQSCELLYLLKSYNLTKEWIFNLMLSNNQQSKFCNTLFTAQCWMKLIFFFKMKWKLK